MSRNFGEGRIEDIRQGATKVCPPSAIYNLDAREMSRPYIGSRCQSIITSPPYYGLRDYGCFGQIGLEDSAGDYINNLVDIFTGLKNSLAEDGTLWVNLGDSYTGSGKGSCNYPENAKKYKQGTNKGMLGVSKLAKIGKQSGGLQRKNLMGIPWRFALAMQSAGWILRQDIIWYKPNCMPESCKDRFTSAYEHIFLFSRNPRYLFNPQSEPAVGFNNAAVAGSQGTFGPKQSRSRAKGNSKTFRGGGNYGGGSENLVVGKDFIVRRLTPLECERLQAFPDNWTAGFADAPRYKALGNSLALVTANFVISRIAKELRMEDGE